MNHLESKLLEIIACEVRKGLTLQEVYRVASTELERSPRTLVRWWQKIKRHCPEEILIQINKNGGLKRIGKFVSEETREKLRIARLNQKNSPTSPAALAKRSVTMKQRFENGYKRNSKKGYRLSLEARTRIRAGILSKRYTPEYAEKLSLSQQGENNSSAVLTDNQVLEIVKMYESGFYTKTAIAEEIGVSRGAVSDILLGRTWTHLTGIEPRT